MRGVMEHIQKRILFSREEIDGRVRELAREISRDYRDKDVILVCVLKGAFIFLADLARYLTIPHTVDFVRLASYGAGTESSGVITITKGLDHPVEGMHVIIVEDILDTGTTAAYLVELLQKMNPRSVKLCCLIDKKARRKMHCEPAYTGFVVGDGFLVGYGLDFNEQFRCLPDICVIEERMP